MITIFSVCHDTASAEGGVQLHASDLGYYYINGRGVPGREHAEFTTCPVPDTVYDQIYMGADAPDGQTFKREPVSGRKHAEAIVASFRNWGIGVAEGEVPSPAELAAAREIYHAFLGQQLQLGQQLWAEDRNPSRIPHWAKVAAQVFGSKVEWMVESSPDSRKRCPNCDSAVPSRAAWCRECHFIFDMGAAIEGGFLPAIQANAAVIAAAASAEEAPAAAAGRKARL